MIPEPMISVGILTTGKPVLKQKQGMTQISNLLIGRNFHWQKAETGLFTGELMELKIPQNDVYLINRLPLEEYLISVIGSEMNSDAPYEFLKAHAVISRSWALRKVLHLHDSLSLSQLVDNEEISEWEDSDAHIGFDVCNDDHCQRYQGYISSIPEKSRNAVKATAGIVLMDSDGQPADARFSKCCGGRTEIFSTCWANQDRNYLKSITDKWCDLSDLNTKERGKFLKSVLKDYDRNTDFMTWTAVVDKKDLRNRIIEKYGRDIGTILHINPLEQGLSGRIKRLQIVGSDGNIIIGKTLAIRRLLKKDCLKSSWFEVTEDSYKFLLTGHGWGHGVGLCQIGAARMASAGKNYEDILRYYYPGTTLQQIYK